VLPPLKVGDTHGARAGLRQATSSGESHMSDRLSVSLLIVLAVLCMGLVLWVTRA